MSIQRCAFLGVTSLLVALLCAIPFDYHRYAGVFQQDGLLGFLLLPSLLVLQLGIVAFGVAFFRVALRQERAVWLRVAAILLGIAAALYLCSLWLIRATLPSGEFGIGLVGFTAIFGLFPSAAFILFVLPLCVLVTIHQSTTQPQ